MYLLALTASGGIINITALGGREGREDNASGVGGQWLRVLMSLNDLKSTRAHPLSPFWPPAQPVAQDPQSPTERGVAILAASEEKNVLMWSEWLENCLRGTLWGCYFQPQKVRR